MSILKTNKSLPSFESAVYEEFLDDTVVKVSFETFPSDTLATFYMKTGSTCTFFLKYAPSWTQTLYYRGLQ